MFKRQGGARKHRARNIHNSELKLAKSSYKRRDDNRVGMCFPPLCIVDMAAADHPILVEVFRNTVGGRLGN